MKKQISRGLIGLVTLSLVGLTTMPSANAASRVRVLSTKKVTKRAYHATNGQMYRDLKLHHKNHLMKNYKYTTWYTYKHATLKIGKKHQSYVYVKAGKLAGWVASKSLKKGKAPAAYRVVSTKKLAKTAYHGTAGNLYRTATLKKRTYKLIAHDKYTTWFATKQAVVNCKGVKRNYLYVINKTKTRYGWIYSKSLKRGQAPVDLVAQANQDHLAYAIASMDASHDTQDQLTTQDWTYESMGSEITQAFGQSSNLNDLRVDKVALSNVYGVFKKRFGQSVRAQLDAADKMMTASVVSTDNLEKVRSLLKSEAIMLGTQVQNIGNTVPLNTGETQLRDDFLAYNYAAMNACADTERNVMSTEASYSQMGYHIGNWYQYSYHVNELIADKQSLLMMYAIFKPRFSTDVQAALDVAAQKLRNQSVNAATVSAVNPLITTFSQLLGSEVANLA